MPNSTNYSDPWEQLDQEIIACRLCPRLVAWREEVARVKKKAYRNEEYWGKPVPGFGDHNARVMIVGLAPGAHGSNRTGRMFTGDASGNFLYAALHRAGFANQPIALTRDDDLRLNDLYIAAICRCVPPQNKPTLEEIRNCQPFLEREFDLLANLQGIVVLGGLALAQTMRILSQRGCEGKKPKFAHGNFVEIGQDFPWILMTYHPSQQNTQTGRLTPAMFDTIWSRVKSLIHP